MVLIDLQYSGIEISKQANVDTSFVKLSKFIIILSYHYYFISRIFFIFVKTKAVIGALLLSIPQIIREYCRNY